MPGALSAGQKAMAEALKAAFKTARDTALLQEGGGMGALPDGGKGKGATKAIKPVRHGKSHPDAGKIDKAATDAAGTEGEEAATSDDIINALADEVARATGVLFDKLHIAIPPTVPIAGAALGPPVSPAYAVSGVALLGPLQSLNPGWVATAIAFWSGASAGPIKLYVQSG